MKKLALILSAAFIFAVMLLPFTAFAADKLLIVDEMGKISEENMDKLNVYAREISQTHKMDVAFLLASHSYAPAQKLKQYTTAKFQNIQDGFVLVHDIDGKLWSVARFGKAADIVTDSVQDSFWEAYKIDDTYYDSVMAYLKKADIFLNNALKPAPSVESGCFSYVCDETGTLTDAQIAALNEKAAALAEKRGLGAYIYIVNLVPEEYAKTIDDLEVYTKAFFEKNGLGLGDDKNGMVLLLETGDQPGERDYLFFTNGACKSVFGNRARERILDNYIVPLFKAAFSNGNFYKVADVFLDRINSEFDRIDSEFTDNLAMKLKLKLAVVILVPILTAWITCSRWKSKMNPANIDRTADKYIPANGFKLTGKTDQFLYRTTTRTKIERDSSSSSSGGGSSSSSSGSSSGGKV